MSRFYITVDDNAHSESKRLNRRADLDMNGSRTVQGTHIVNYEKRVVDSNTFLSIDNGNCICVSGTMMYDGRLGGTALRDVYHTFMREGVEGVREKAFGHYALTIKKDTRLVVVCDPNGVYETYYTEDDHWFISNSLYLCAYSLDQRVIDRHGLYQRAIEYSEISKRTPYKNIRRMSGSQKLEINLATQDISSSPISAPTQTWSYTNGTFKGVLDEYTNRTRSVFREIGRATDDIAVQATGGLDSRTVLAGLLDQGIKPDIVHGVGNSQLTNTKKEDYLIAQKYADRFNLHFQEMDWSGNYPISVETWNRLFEKYGFRYHTYGATPNFFSEYASIFNGGPELVMSGYGFGTFSNDFFWEKDWLLPISFERAAADVFSRASMFRSESFQCKEKYLDEVICEAKHLLSEFGVDVDQRSTLDQQGFTRIIQLLNGRPQSAFVNIVNEFTYHLAPFATYKLGRPMIDFPYEYRRGERLRVKILAELYSDIIDVDIFSGGERMNTSESGQLMSTQKSIRKALSNNLPDAILECIRPLYRYFNLPKNDKLILQEDLSRLTKDGVVSECFNLSKYDGDIRWVSRLAQFEHGVEVIGYDGVQRKH